MVKPHCSNFSCVQIFQISMIILMNNVLEQHYPVKSASYPASGREIMKIFGQWMGNCCDGLEEFCPVWDSNLFTTMILSFWTDRSRQTG